MHAIDHTHGDKAKTVIKQRCEQYLNRAEELKRRYSYVQKKNDRKIKPMPSQGVPSDILSSVPIYVVPGAGGLKSSSKKLHDDLVYCGPGIGRGGASKGGSH